MTESDRKRLVILHCSLGIEKIASHVLSYIFDRDDFKETRSFGNTSHSLSFNQKMNLLLDYKAIEKADIKKFEAVMNVRNKFMHNADCETFVDAIGSLDGAEKSLKSLYPNAFKSEDKEKCLEDAIELAFRDCVDILTTPKGGIEQKISNDNQRAVYKELALKMAKNTGEKFSELALEIHSNEFNFGDKYELLQRLVKLRTDIFNFDKEREDP